MPRQQSLDAFFKSKTCDTNSVDCGRKRKHSTAEEQEGKKRSLDGDLNDKENATTSQSQSVPSQLSSCQLTPDQKSRMSSNLWQAKLLRSCRSLPSALHENLGVTWFRSLEPVFNSPGFRQLDSVLATERASVEVFPPRQLVWNWTTFFELKDTKVTFVFSFLLKWASMSFQEEVPDRFTDQVLSSLFLLKSVLSAIFLSQVWVERFVAVLIVLVLASQGFSMLWTLCGFVLIHFYDIVKTASNLVDEWAQGHDLGSLRLALRLLALKQEAELETEAAFDVVHAGETLEWLNRVIAVLWNQCLVPFVPSDLRHSLQAQLNEIVDESGLMFRLLTPIDIQRLELGSAYPWFTGIKTSYCSDLAVEVEMGIHLDLCPVIILQMMGRRVEVGLDRLKISLPFRLTLAPLTEDFFVCRALYLSALKTPDLEIGLRGLLSPLTGIEAMKRLMIWSVRRVITSACVYPKALTINNPAVKHIDNNLSLQEPLGLLRVRVEEACGLRLNTHCIACRRYPDPYCVMRVRESSIEKQIERTRVIKKDRNPKWKHVYEVGVLCEDLRDSGKSIEIRVFDFNWGFWIIDRQLGEAVHLKLRSLLQPTDAWYDLERGKVHVITDFFPTLNHTWRRKQIEVSAAFEESSALLQFVLLEVTMDQPFKPIVVFDISGRSSVASNIGEKSVQWSFRQHFLWPIHDADRDRITISLLDAETNLPLIQNSSKLCEKIKSAIIRSSEVQDVSEGQVLRADKLLLAVKSIRIGDLAREEQRQTLVLDTHLGGLFQLTYIARIHPLALSHQIKETKK